MENEKNKKFDFKSLYQNKQYRSIIALALYVILFIVLIVLVNNSSNIVNQSSDVSNDISSSIAGYDLIKNNNFSYKYTLTLDDEIYTFEGKKYQNKDLFTLTNKDQSDTYYINNDIVYIKVLNSFLESELPDIIFNFFDTSIIEMILTEGILDGNQYRITNQSLFDLLGDESKRVDDEPNYAVLKYRNTNITSIDLDITNYSKLLGNKYQKVTISLEYNEFNLIDDFDINL